MSERGSEAFPEYENPPVIEVVCGVLFAPLEQLCLSPQCGFASSEEGNTLAEEEQWAKLRLAVDVALGAASKTDLEEVFATLDERVRGKHCDGIAGIIEEGKSVMEKDFDEATMERV